MTYTDKFDSKWEILDRYRSLPEPVANLMRNAIIAQYATVSAAGVPIDTPLLCFASPGLASIDISTGVSYPAKADRARRNPKVGLLLEGSAEEPVVAIAGMAEVRDTDIQANLDRYLPEYSAYLHTTVGDTPWSVVRQAIWYWSRILVHVHPLRILWWSSPAQLDQPPSIWEAPEGTVFPPSDPSPAGKGSAPPPWPVPQWRDVANEMAGGTVPPHLALIDADGFPLPFPVRSVKVAAGGLALDVGEGAPWRDGGKATLTYAGRATFVGEVSGRGSQTFLAVERMLPVLPLVQTVSEVWDPSEETRQALMARLDAELARRGQSRPIVPECLPEPTPWSILRSRRRAGDKLDAE